MASDPICGMYVDERTSQLKLVRDNRTYSFCSTTCLHEFAEPALQLSRVRLKLAVAWPLSIIILVLTYGGRPAGWPYAAWLLASVVQFYAGIGFYRGLFDAFRNRNPNMDVLIAIGTTAAYVYSAIALLLPRLFPPAYYFDASALIVTLILTGNYLEHLTRDRAGSALRRLHDLLPPTARKLVGMEEKEVSAEDVQVGNHLRIRAGERFPADGIIAVGQTTVNESLLTGESLPVVKKPGDRVIAGSVNGEGVVETMVTGVGHDTFLAEIGRLLTDAETSHVPLQRTADRVAAIFVPSVLGLAVVASLGWHLIGGATSTIALLVFVSVVITACPCAFGLATPAAIIVGTGRAAEEGVLFKGQDAIDQASTVDIVLTDKTGTLTLGRPELTDVVPIPPMTEVELLALTAGLERFSEHPLGRAVVEGARTRGITPDEIQNAHSEPGRGVIGTAGVSEVRILRGSAFDDEDARLRTLERERRRVEAEGKTWSVVERGDRVVGMLAFSDTVAPDAGPAIDVLRREGIPTVMVTGDRLAAAQAIAEKVGISQVYAGVTPARKVELVHEFQSRGKRVAFVGDGINDAAALAAADVGIAIGAGADVAREAGKVILVRSDFSGVPFALRAARRTVRKVAQNIFWALGYNAILLPIAAGILVPWTGFGAYAILPITGAIAMAISSTTVVLNSLSLRWIRRTSVGRVPSALG